MDIFTQNETKSDKMDVKADWLNFFTENLDQQ